ncbi:hypothetical protein JA1_003552 [Spathaspora sp. JA1]|nr:hypothetical protein JA1_003552 [Spathaspora sp. JA1]
MDETIESRIGGLEALIKGNPYVAENYDKLVGLLQVSSNPLKIHDVYKRKLELFRLKQSELITWYDTLLKIQDDDLQHASSQVEYFESLLSDCPDVNTWKRYLSQCNTLIKMEIIDDEDYKLLLQRALNDCVYDFVNSHEIWQIILSYFYKHYLNTESREDWEYLIKLHLKRLSHVHERLEDSFSDFSTLISKHDSENYDQQLKNANRIYSKTKSQLHYYEKFELQIKTTPSNPQIYIAYIENVGKYDPNSMLTILNRSIQEDYSWSNQWQSVWMAVIYQLYTREHKSGLLESILLKFIRTFPNSCIPYAEFIQNCLQFDYGETLFTRIKHRIDSIDLMHNSEYSEWKLVASAILKYRFDAKDKINLDIDALEYLEFAIEYNNDISHTIEKLACSIFQKLGDIEQASNIVDLMVNKFNNQVDVWLYMINFLINNSASTELIRETFQNAISFVEVLDNPERIVQEWLIFEQVNGDVKTYRSTVLECNVVTKLIENNRDQPEPEPKPVKSNQKNENKRKIEEETEPVRSREEFTVKVSNINCRKQDLITMFQDCGEIREINLLEDNALIEFTNDQSVLSALTKNHKQINESDIVVTKLGNSTLYVNNFPSTYTQAQIKEKFESIGPTVSIRFPHQNNPNKTKRFCYVQYVNPDDAKRAIVLYNGEKLHDEQFNTDFTLQVSISRPQEKKPRGSAISDRKIRVSNLSFELTEQEIKDIFVNCGSVDSIVIPRKNRNHANEGVAIIVFQDLESVSQALELNNTEIRGRKLNVEKPKPHQSHQLNVRDFNKVKTIGLTNIDTTLSSNDIKAQLESKFGSIEKVMTMPETASALVEFSSPSSAGKVSMVSDKIRLGQTEATITDMNSVVYTPVASVSTSTTTTTSAKSSQPRIMVPASVKRRKKN